MKKYVYRHLSSFRK